MDHAHKKYLVIGGVVVVGGVMYLRSRSAAAASAAAAQSAQNADATTDLSTAIPTDTTEYDPSGQYATSATSGTTSVGSATSGTASTGIDGSVGTNVSAFASLLQSILGTGQTYANSAASTQSAQSAQAAGATAAAAPSPTPAPSPSSTPITGPLFSVIGDVISPNNALMSNPVYEQAWASVAQQNQSASGSQWNIENTAPQEAAANAQDQANLTNEVQSYINKYSAN